MTDGWYSIDVHCDTALKQLVESNKIFAGVKLAISGAELVSPGPTTPLEKGADTFLRVFLLFFPPPKKSIQFYLHFLDRVEMYL